MNTAHPKLLTPPAVYILATENLLLVETKNQHAGVCKRVLSTRRLSITDYVSSKLSYASPQSFTTMSIWDGVDRTAFESNLSALLKRGKYQDVSRLSGRFVLREAEDDPPVLDANTESQLADDFAFLASTTTWPRDVTAAAVQQKSDPDRLCVSIAANQGIPVSVQNAFQKILENLERRASRSRSLLKSARRGKVTNSRRIRKGRNSRTLPKRCCSGSSKQDLWASWLSKNTGPKGISSQRPREAFFAVERGPCQNTATRSRKHSSATTWTTQAAYELHRSRRVSAQRE